MSQVLSIANEKGGVAKTTTAFSLGGALVKAGQKVLMVDLDPQCNLSLSLGIEPQIKVRSFINLAMENLNIQDVIRHSEIENLDILPANKEIGYSERVLPGKVDYAVILKNVLAPARDIYDFVVVDCPPFLGALTLNALTASDLLIIPTQAEYYSIYALRNMMGLVRQVRKSGNAGLRYRLLITLFDKRNNIHRTLAKHLRATFAGGVLDTVISVDTKLRESPITGMPVGFHAKKSRAAQQYLLLAEEIVQYVKG